MTTFLHESRLAAVTGILAHAGARRVLDLGCGRGDLVVRLLENPHCDGIIAVDQDSACLSGLRARISEHPRAPYVSLIQGDITAPLGIAGAVDAVTLVEVIEHLDPARLAALERRVMAEMAPPLVVVTTPNVEMNALLGVPAGRRRHPGHRFEWDRAQFAQWANRVGARTGYGVEVAALAGAHPRYGGASQMVVFRRL